MDKIKIINGDKEHIFWTPEGKKQPFISSGNANSELMKVSLDKQTGHGWRKVFVEGTQTANFPPHIIERCIGHKQRNRIHATYDTWAYMNERKEAMEKVANHITSHIYTDQELA